MQEQVFSLSIVYDEKTGLNMDELKNWMRKTIAGRVDRYMGLVSEGFGSSAAGRVVQYALHISHGSEVTAEMLTGYLADTPAGFSVENVTKRYP
jgi:hypothetical protein